LKGDFIMKNKSLFKKVISIFLLASVEIGSFVSAFANPPGGESGSPTADPPLTSSPADDSETGGTPQGGHTIPSTMVSSDPLFPILFKVSPALAAF
jgi:hypothetical protein